MRFRTELEPGRSPRPITREMKIVSLGSCFSRAIGQRLADGGFDISVTPMGILFNPVSIGNVVSRAFRGDEYRESDLYLDGNGVSHALDFESTRQDESADRLLEKLNSDFGVMRRVLTSADVWLVTFGTAWCFRHLPSDRVVGNCHKLPDSQFDRRLCSVADIIDMWSPIVEKVNRVIFTVSPVRHLNDGLHGNTLSKARLHLAVEELCARHGNAEYFPAFEALVDDLRDYRFYADDLKHPSVMAEEYIFDKFSSVYFSAETRRKVEQNRSELLRDRHRPIIK